MLIGLLATDRFDFDGAGSTSSRPPQRAEGPAVRTRRSASAAAGRSARQHHRPLRPALELAGGSPAEFARATCWPRTAGDIGRDPKEILLSGARLAQTGP